MIGERKRRKAVKLFCSVVQTRFLLELIDKRQLVIADAIILYGSMVPNFAKRLIQAGIAIETDVEAAEASEAK